MKARAMVRDDSMRRAARIGRLERRSRASYAIAAAVFTALALAACWQAFASPCIGGPSC